jgi:hypothetical protein
LHVVFEGVVAFAGWSVSAFQKLYELPVRIAE